MIRQFAACDYHKIIELAEGIKVRFVDAGHLLGSASIELWITEDGEERILLFCRTKDPGDAIFPDKDQSG